MILSHPPIRRFMAAALLAPALVLSAPAAAQSPPAERVPDRDTNLPVVAGLGAIAGVIGLNLLAFGLPALPGVAAAAPVVAAELSVAMSRVYATVSAVVGGLVANRLYEAQGEPANAAEWLIDPHLVAIGAGAIVGAVTFNLFSTPFGTVPLAGGELAPVPAATALGSRLLAGAAVAAGAVGATAAYDWVTGHATDYGYAAALAAGAFGGIAVGNLLTGGLGALPYYAGAGEAAASAGAMASAAAQAASRVYVVTSGVLGAWAADFLWRLDELPPVPRNRF